MVILSNTNVPQKNKCMSMFGLRICRIANMKNRTIRLPSQIKAKYLHYELAHMLNVTNDISFLKRNCTLLYGRSRNRRVENFTATMLAYLGNFEDLDLLHSTHTIMKLSISHSHQESCFSTFCLPKEFPILNNVNTYFYS